MKDKLDCLFCQIVQKKKPAHIILEDENCLAFLDLNPNSEGHTLIVPKRHIGNIIELDKDDWNNLFIFRYKNFTFFQTVINSLQKVLQPKGFNFITNMGKDAYQSIFHFHLHIIPKYKINQGFIWNVCSENRSVELIETANKIRQHMNSED